MVPADTEAGDRGLLRPLLRRAVSPRHLDPALAPRQISQAMQLRPAQAEGGRPEEAAGMMLSDPAGRECGGELRLAIAISKSRHRSMIVRHVTEADGPFVTGRFQDGVARIGRAGLDDMRIRMDIAIAGAADATRIDD